MGLMPQIRAHTAGLGNQGNPGGVRRYSSAALTLFTPAAAS